LRQSCRRSGEAGVSVVCVRASRRPQRGLPAPKYAAECPHVASASAALRRRLCVRRPNGAGRAYPTLTRQIRSSRHFPCRYHNRPLTRRTCAAQGQSDSLTALSGLPGRAR